jgi:hypothetical protein
MPTNFLQGYTLDGSTLTEYKTELDALAGVPAGVIRVGQSGAVDYNTITAGVAAASAGQTVLVYPGTYAESNPIVVPVGVTVVGIGGHEVTALSCLNAEQHGFILSNDVAIKELEVRNASGVGKAGFFIPAGVLQIEILSSSIVDCNIGWLSESADGIVVSGAYLRTGTMASVAKVQAGGHLSLIDIKVGDNVNATNILHADGVGSRLVISGFAVFGPGDGSMVNGFYVQNGGEIRASNCFVDGVDNAIHIASSDGTFIGSGIAIVNSQNLDIWTEGGSGTSVQISSGSFDNTLVGQALGTRIIAAYGERAYGHLGSSVIGGLNIGTPKQPSESSFGEGNSTVRDMVVMTDNGTGTAWADITSNLIAGTSQALFASVAENQRVLIGNKSRVFSGWVDVVNTVFATAAGKLSVGLSTAPGVFSLVPVMTVDAEAPNMQHAGEIFQRAQASHVRFDPKHVTWTQETYNGITAYWVEIKIIGGAITTVPILQSSATSSLQLHTNRSRIASDGFATNFGNSIREYDIKLPLQRALSGSAPSNEVVNFTTGIDRDGALNSYAAATVNGVVYGIAITAGIDTSRPMIFRTLWYPSNGGVGDVELELNYRIVKPGDVLDGALVDTNIAVVATVSGVSKSLQPVVEHKIDISSAVPGDLLVLSHFRDGSVGNVHDTYANSIIIVDRSLAASFWHG